MATLKQIEASRANGAKSRGPVTTEGKARTRLNGAKHGIYSKAIVLNNEDPDAYALILHNALTEWAPATHTEHRLVTDMVNAEWRIDRLTAYETAALDFETDRMRPEIDEAFEQIDEPTRATLAFNSVTSNNGAWDRIQTALRTQYRIRDRALSQLVKLRKLRRAGEVEAEVETAGPQTTEPATATLPTTNNSHPACACRLHAPEPARTLAILRLAEMEFEKHRSEPGKLSGNDEPEPLETTPDKAA